MSIQTQTEPLKAVKAKNVFPIDLRFVEVLGQLRSFTVSKAVLEKGLQEGISFDGSLFAGSARSKEEYMLVA
jgi:glutamine synthetase